MVVNRDGASGTIGTAAVAAAKPDGYTLAFTASGPLTIQPHVIPTLAYKPGDLQPLCQVFASQYVFAVRADSPFKILDPDYPDAPTLKAMGYQVVSTAFGGLIGPKGMSDDVVKTIDAAREESLLDERFRNTARQSSQEAIYRNGLDYARILSEDSVVKLDVVIRAGVKGP